MTLGLVLNKKLEELIELEGVSSRTELTKDLHMYPDLHGGFIGGDSVVITLNCGE